MERLHFNKYIKGLVTDLFGKAIADFDISKKDSDIITEFLTLVNSIKCFLYLNLTKIF